MRRAGALEPRLVTADSSRRAGTLAWAINTRWLLLTVMLMLFAFTVQAAPAFPPLTGRVVDAANVLSAETEQRLTTRLAQHASQTTNQVVVVTLADLQDYEISDYGYQLGRHWGIGQKGEDNGALLIIAPNERKLRIEVGYGLEGTLTDALSSDIIRNTVVPHLRDGDFDAAATAGTLRMLAVLEGDTNAASIHKQTSAQDIPGWAIFLFLVFVIGFVMLASIGGYHMNGRRGGFHTGGFGGGGFGGGGFGGGGGGFGGGGASGGW